MSIFEKFYAKLKTVLFVGFHDKKSPLCCLNLFRAKKNICQISR